MCFYKIIDVETHRKHEKIWFTISRCCNASCCQDHLKNCRPTRSSELVVLWTTAHKSLCQTLYMYSIKQANTHVHNVCIYMIYERLLVMIKILIMVLNLAGLAKSHARTPRASIFSLWATRSCLFLSLYYHNYRTISRYFCFYFELLRNI